MLGQNFVFVGIQGFLHVFVLFLFCLFYVVFYFVLGYGDIYCKTILGKVAVILIIFGGLVCTFFLFSLISLRQAPFLCS